MTKEINTISKRQYYHWMGSFDEISDDAKEVEKRWRACFKYAIVNWHSGFSKKAVDELFDRFEMDNWPDLAKENTEYDSHTQYQIRESFAGDAHYISDRASFDRIFRVHWLYRRGYVDGA